MPGSDRRCNVSFCDHLIQYAHAKLRKQNRHCAAWLRHRNCFISSLALLCMCCGCSTIDPAPLTRSGNSAKIDDKSKKIILSVMERNRYSKLYFGYGIPENKEENARQACRVPPAEDILALLDLTIFGSAKVCLLLSDTGVYFVSEYPRGVHYLTYDSFVESKIYLYKDDVSTVIIGEKKINVYSQDSGHIRVANMLADLKRNLLAAKVGAASSSGPDAYNTNLRVSQGGMNMGHVADQADASVRRLSRSIVLPQRTWSTVNVAVADLNAYALSSGEVKTLTEVLQSTLVSTDYFSVLSRSDMKDVLEAQAFQSSSACDETACLVEMGHILSVQKIIGGTLGRVGSTYSLSLRFVDVETGKTELSINDQWRGEADGLLTLVQDTVKVLAGEYAAKVKNN